MVPARISARQPGATSPPADCCDFHQLQIPGIASFLLLSENQAEYVRNQRQAYAALQRKWCQWPLGPGHGGAVVRHAPAAAGATVRYRSLQWTSNNYFQGKLVRVYERGDTTGRL
jgi:hypothetical protein